MTARSAGSIPAPHGSGMRRDIASAYLASAARIGSWALVSAILFRFAGTSEFAMFALVRGTLGILNYVSLGLAPAVIHQAAALTDEQLTTNPADGIVLNYAAPRSIASPLARLYASAAEVALGAGSVGVLLTVVYAWSFSKLYRVPGDLVEQMPRVVLGLGIGLLMRLCTDAAGAVLQARSRITLDNLVLASSDGTWAVLTVAALLVNRTLGTQNYLLEESALAYAASGFVCWVRIWAAGRETGVTRIRRDMIDRNLVRMLLRFGGLVTVAQLADYLYAPTDYILIDRLLNPIELAHYAPAVQIDAALLVLVTGLASVLLPKAAIAHAAGAPNTVLSYYLRGSLASLALLATAALAVWLISPWLLRLWLGNPMPATQAILPLVLTHTVIGGSSAVGRSILLAVGKVKPFTIAVLIAGVTNVVCSFAFVRYLHWGLRGIVLGTIVAVVARCGIWMPWYVMRTLRHGTPLTANAVSS